MLLQLWENFRRKIAERFEPTDESPVGLLLLRGDELEAARDALRPGHTAADDRVKILKERLFRPRQARGEQDPTLRDCIADYEAAIAELQRIDAKMSELGRQVRETQEEIVWLLEFTNIDEVARTRARLLVTGHGVVAW